MNTPTDADGPPWTQLSGRSDDFLRPFLFNPVSFEMIQFMPPGSPPESAAPTGIDSTVSPDRLVQFRDAVRRFVVARVRDDAAADDLTQEIFVRVLRRLPQVRDPRRVMGWLFQIARHVVADHFRRQRPSETLTDRHADDAGAGAEVAAREELELRDNLALYIRSVVNGLPATYREALLLTEYEGLTQVELAQHLGLTVSAAKSRVQRARQQVRATIERCCHFEFDRYGTVVECQRRETRCGCTGQETSAAGGATGESGDRRPRSA